MTEHIGHIANSRHKFITDKSKVVFNPTKLDELMRKDFPVNTWLVEGLIPANGITMLSAPPSSYKTWLLLEVGICVATGRQLFGCFETRQLNVLIIDEESGEPMLQRRLKKLSVPEGSPIYFRSLQQFKIERKHINALLKYCKQKDIGLVIFDSLVRIHDKDENDAVKIASIFQMLKECTVEGITVVIAHHHRKSGNYKSSASQEMRGSSDILASSDCHISMSRSDKKIKVTQTKLRIDEEMEPFEIEVVNNEDSVSLEYVGKLPYAQDKNAKVISQIKEVLIDQPGISQKELLTLLKKRQASIGERSLRSLLKKMEEDNEIETSPGLKNAKKYRLFKENPDE